MVETFNGLSFLMNQEFDGSFIIRASMIERGTGNFSINQSLQALQ